MRYTIISSLIMALLFFQPVNAEREGYSPYSGTTVDDFKPGGEFDLNSNEGYENFVEHNRVEQPTIVDQQAMSVIANNILPSLKQSIDKEFNKSVSERGADSLLQILKETGMGLLLAIQPSIQEEFGENAAKSFLNLTEDSLLSQINRLDFDLKNVTKGFVIGQIKNLAIESISDSAKKMSNSNVVGGAVWLALKHIDAHSTSVSLPMVAYNEALLAGEIWWKVGEETINALDAKEALDRSLLNGKLLDLEIEYTNKISQANNASSNISGVEAFNLEEELLEKINALKDGNNNQYLYEAQQRITTSIRLFQREKQAILDDLVNSGKNDKAIAYINAYFGGAAKQQMYEKYEEQLELEPIQARTVIIEDDSSVYLSKDDDGEEEQKLEPETLVNPNLEDDQASDAEVEQLRQEINTKSRAQLNLVEKIQPYNDDLDALNNRISEKRSEIENLRQQLEALSASSADRFQARALLIKYRLIKHIYDKYDGDITKVNNIDRDKLKALSETLPDNWVRLFQNAPSRYASAQAEAAALNSAGNNQDAQRIQQKIDQLESQITALSDVIDKKTEERRILVVQYEDSQKELIALVEEVNDATKEEIGNAATPNNLYEKLHGAVSLIGSNALGYRYQYDGGFLTVDNDNAFDATEQFKSSSDSGNSNHYSSAITINNPTPTDGYQYTAWGKWTHPNLILTTHDGKAFNVTEGHYVMGVATKDIPKTGTATYTGNLKGDYIDTPSSSGIVQKDAIGGTINLNVNFASSSMSATLNATRNGSSWATAQMNNINIESGNDFYHQGTGNEVVGGGSAGLSGTFYGPNAEEAGGGFYINKQSEGSGASGVFRAKKQ